MPGLFFSIFIAAEEGKVGYNTYICSKDFSL